MRLLNNLGNGAKLISGFLLLYNLNSCSISQCITGRTQEGSLQKQELKGENIKGETILLPIKWHGNIRPYDSNSWLNSNTLMSIPEIYGKISAELKAVVNNKDTIDVYIKQAPLERILELYQKENKKLKTKLWKNEFLSREVRDSLFYNGIRGDEYEFDNLKNGVYGFWYISSNKQASLPGIFVVNKGKVTELYELKEKKTEKVSEDKVDSSKIQQLRQDTIKVHKCKKKSDETKKTIIEKDSLERRLDTTRIRGQEILTSEEEKIVKESLKKYNFDLGFGYDDINNGNYNLIMRYNIKNFILGLEIGYGEGSKDPVDGFNIMGLKKIIPKNNDFRYLSLEAGYNLGLISLIINGGLETNNLIITKELRGINDKTESYTENKKTDKFMHGFGADLNFGRIKLGGRIRSNGGKYYYGGKLMLSI